MTLDGAIKHAEAVAEKKFDNAVYIMDKIESGKLKSDIALSNAEECKRCAQEHRQLAEWLKELKQLREQTRMVPVSEGLPDIHNYTKEYLVTLKRGGVYIAMFTECDGKHWWTYDDVVAWAQMPKEYKADNEG